MRTVMAVILLLLLVLPVPLPSEAAENPSRTYDVIIVGGGIAGLTAAYYLDDYELLLLEKEKEVGGRTTSGEYRGLSYARGTEYLGTPEEPLKEIISSLGLTLREVPAPADVLSYGGKLFFGDYGKARLLVSKSSLPEFNRFVGTILAAIEDYEEIPELHLEGEFKRLDTITARQWFAENHFPQIYSEIYNVTFRGLFGANMDEVSALAALPEMAFDFEGFERYEDIEDLVEAFADDGSSTGMYSFDRGIAEIPLAIADMLGASIRTGVTVTGVRRIGDLFEVNATQSGNKNIIYRAEAVILATPSGIALDLASDSLGEEQRQLLGSVRYAPYLTIALFSEKPVFNQGFDLAVPDGLLVTDIYDATWVERHYSDKSGVGTSWITLVCAAPASYRDAQLLHLSDQELINTILAQLDLILPGSSKLINGWDIKRYQNGYPVMTPGSYQRMSRLLSITDNGLYLAGDYLLYPTFEAAALSGQLAAQMAVDWLED